jgi:hypothetical protein
MMPSMNGWTGHMMKKTSRKMTMTSFTICNFLEFFYFFLIRNFVFSFPVWLKLTIGSKKQGIKEGIKGGH